MPTFFAIPYENKQFAKTLGALWNGDISCWFAADDKTAYNLALAGFAMIPNPAPITSLPGEDRKFGGNSLFVDLVPRSCWFTNVRYCIDKSDWQRLSKGIRSRSGNVCEICGVAADLRKNLHLEAHERWEFDRDSSTQVLKRIISLCRMCHLTTHWGYAQIQGLEEEVKGHLKAINGWEEIQALIHVEEAFDRWMERSERDWTLDLSIIENASIKIIRPVQKHLRRVISDESLA